MEKPLPVAGSDAPCEAKKRASGRYCAPILSNTGADKSAGGVFGARAWKRLAAQEDSPSTKVKSMRSFLVTAKYVS